MCTRPKDEVLRNRRRQSRAAEPVVVVPDVAVALVSPVSAAAPVVAARSTRSTTKK